MWARVKEGTRVEGGARVKEGAWVEGGGMRVWEVYLLPFGIAARF